MNKFMIKLIRSYQTKVSPKKEPRCRHKPTCSAYALESYERFNFFKATYLATKRILTCNPLFKPKYDPVPKKKIKIPKLKNPLINNRK